LLTHFTIERSR